MEIIPIVTLDKIFIEPDEENIFFLDCTRINGTNKVISRKKESIDEQVEKIGNTLKGKEIILADDVVFSGSVLKTIIEKLEKYNIKVIKIIASISSEQAYDYFNKKLKYGIKTNFIMQDYVIDQICERDFYFGIAGSGIMIETQNGYFKAPYFFPYGNPVERASIPIEYEKYFSRSCLDRSITLWEDIDKNKEKNTTIEELPEKIIKTNNKDEVVKTLEKERRRIWQSYR